MSVPTDAYEVFRGMAVNLVEPTRWTKGFAARDGHGMPCDPSSPKATCWCLDGARDRELFKIADPVLRQRLDEETDEILHECLNGASPSAMNDGRHTTHADVMALIRQASSMTSVSRKV